MPVRTATPRQSRRGAVVPLVIAVMPALMAAFVLAIQITSLRHRYVELQIATDAARLAGANALVPTNDTLLFSHAAEAPVTVPDPIPTATKLGIFSNARAVAIDYAHRNQFLTQGLVLQDNPTNDPNGELVLGTQDAPTGPVFDTSLTGDWLLYSPKYNTVKVAVRRTNAVVGLQNASIASTAKAYVDRDVIGFKVQGSSQTLSGPNPAIPVVPIGIRTNFAYVPPVQPTDVGSWDNQIIYRNGPDTNGNGISEITVNLTGLVSVVGAANNGQMFDIGAGTVAVATSQIGTGITFTQLATYDPIFQELTLNPNHTAPDNRVQLNRFTAVNLAGNFAAIDAALTSLMTTGARRVWPLFDQPSNVPPAARVVGFVAARVIAVTSTGTSVSATLEPTMFITCTAITDRARRALGPRTVFGINSIFNPYTCRVRLVD